MNKLLFRTAVVVAGGGAALALAAGPALAHECFNVSRAQQADAQIAAHSHGWFDIQTWQFIALGASSACDAEPCPPPPPGTDALATIDPELLTGAILGFVDPTQVTSPDQLTAFHTLVAFSQQVAAVAAADGVPSHYLTLANATAAGGAEHSGQGVTSDGHGIDHVPDVYGAQLTAAYLARYCAAVPQSPMCDNA
jgi:hypothetical protein